MAHLRQFWPSGANPNWRSPPAVILPGMILQRLLRSGQAALAIQKNPQAKFAAALLAGAATVLLVFARFLPGTPMMLVGTVDAGWAWGINAAAARGMVFGRDMIFTYGPYAAVASGVYDAALRWMMLGGGGLLGAAFAAGLLALGRPAPALLCGLAVTMAASMDSLVFALPLPAMVLCARMRPAAGITPGTVLAIAALIPALALLPLIKVSYLVSTLIGSATVAICLWRAGRGPAAAACAALVPALLAVFWCAAGQPLAALPRFFTTAAWIATGYNDSMARTGPCYPAVLAVLSACAALALLAWIARHLPRASAAMLLAGTAILLFMALKAGFVRQDFGHMPITFAAIGLVFIVLANATARPLMLPAALAGVLLIAKAASISGQPHALHALAQAPVQRLRAGWALLARPDHAAAAARAGLAYGPTLPWHPPGTADIYSTGQLRLLAYTPALAAINAAHLRQAVAPHGAAPDNVFIRIEPVDDHLPALEDGPSWPLLLSLYDNAGYDGASNTLWLARAAAPAPAEFDRPSATLPPTTTRRGDTGARITLPLQRSAPGAQAIWATIDIRPTLAGRIAATLWRAPLLHILLDFDGAASRDFRFVPGMAQAGFLLSPFVGSTLDFLRLRAAGGAASGTAATDLPPKPVAITLRPDPGGAWAWQSSYGITLQAGSFAPRTQPVRVQNTAAPRALKTLMAGPGASCFLDRVDGDTPPAAAIPAIVPIQLEGWALFDKAAGLPADRVEIGLQSGTNPVFAIPAYAVPRQDVADTLHSPGAIDAGFTTVADLSGLPPGHYTSFVIVTRGTESRACTIALSVEIPAKP
jgi:hypothetical protein